MKLTKEKITLPTLYSIPADSETQRNELVLQAREHRSVTTSADQNSVVETARTIRTCLRDVEDARTLLKKPLLDAGRQIDALAKDFVAPLTGELIRLEKLVTDFQQAEARRVAAEEAARAAEIARLERERLAIERAERERAERARQEADRLERERLAAEAAAAAASQRDRTAKQRAAALAAEKIRQDALAAEQAARAEAARAALEAEEAARAAEAARQSVIVSPLPEANKSGGASTRKVMRWEVTDLRALYAARPELCTIEAKASAINAVCVPELPVPGIRLWWEDKTTIRRW